MDPISQGVLGAVVTQAAMRSSRLGWITICGCLAALAPDIDVIFQSDIDPLLFLQYHRQFTHALAFIPFGALAVALLLFPLARRHLPFSTIYIACLVGYATHGFLDACTSYGTQLLWPFSDHRFAWNNVSVVDPLFTVPVVLLVVIAVYRSKRLFAWLGLGWVAIYLSFGMVQSQRAQSMGETLAASRGHVPLLLTAKPGFGNLLVWKTVYEFDDTFYVDAVRMGLTAEVCRPSSSRPRLDIDRDFPWLRSPQQLKDIERFRWFSDDYLAVDRHNPNLIVDLRYSVVPNEVDPLWGILINPNADDAEHVQFVESRSVSEAKRSAYLNLLTGDACSPT